ncbi:heat shock transcription factor, X-linked member 3-like [Glossophaga mutica]
MASSNINEMDEAKPDPSNDRAPPIRVQADTSLDPNVDTKEASKGHGDQAQDNLQPQNPNQVVANIDGNNILLGLSFPRKLWRIVEDNTFMSVQWNENGDTLIIREDLFRREVLCCMGTEKIFKSDGLKSFICPMNLYRFSKNFKREGNWMTTATWPGTSATPPKRKKKQVAPTGRSPRMSHRGGSKAADPKTQKKAPSAPGHSGTRSFKFLDLWSTSSAMIVLCPSEPGGPSREGTSRNVTFETTAPARTNGAGEPPTSHPDDPLYDSVMSLYNTCFSILMAALSVMAPPTDPHEEEEQEEQEEEEGSCDDLCALYKQFRDTTGP